MEKNINSKLDPNDIDTTPNFNQLPKEIKLDILQKTLPTVVELAKFSLICNQWQIISQDKSVWDPKNHFISKQHLIDTANSAKKSIGENWQLFLNWIIRQGGNTIFTARNIYMPDSNEIYIACFGRGNKQNLVDKYRRTPHYPTYDNYLEIGKDVTLYKIFHTEELPKEVNIALIFPETDLTNIQELINQAKLSKGNKLIFVMSTNENHKKLINSNIECQGVFNIEEEKANDFHSLVSNIYNYVFNLKMLTSTYSYYSEKNEDKNDNKDDDYNWTGNIRMNFN